MNWEKWANKSGFLNTTHYFIKYVFRHYVDQIRHASRSTYNLVQSLHLR